MYVCIYTTTGASYPPHPMGGGGNTGHGTIYIYNHIYTYIQWISLREKLQETHIFHGKIYGFL